MITKKIRDLAHVSASSITEGADDLYCEFINLLLNNVSIFHKDGKQFDYRVEKKIKTLLIETNKVGYDRLVNKWTEAYGTGKLDDLGYWTWVNFIFPNGTSYRRQASYAPKDNGAYIVEALPYDFTLAKMIKNACAFIANCDIAIVQNINAIKTPYIIACKNDNIKLSIEHAIEDKENGKPVLVVSNELGEAVKPNDIKVEYVAKDIDELKQKRIDQLINKLGIMSANINKKERVQVGEVNATLGQCLDYIYLMIDTFNKQCETYGIDAVMIENTSLNEYEDKKDDGKDPSKEGNENE